MDDPTLAALVRDVAKRELGEDDETREQALGLFRAWVVKNPNIRNCRTDDIFLLAFLRVKKFSINQAQQSLIMFLECCQSVRKLTSNLDVKEFNINVFCSKPCMYLSPFRDAKGRSVFINHPAGIDPTDLSYIDHGRTVFTMLFSLINDSASQVLGYVHVFDLRGYGVVHATFWPVLEMVGLMKSFQNALPFRHKEIHVITMHSAVKVLFNLILQTTSQKIKDRVHIHDTLEDLHKQVSPDVLPKEYGGHMPALEMSALWKQKMLESRELVLGMSNMRLLQDNRGKAVETGSFRKLAID